MLVSSFFPDDFWGLNLDVWVSKTKHLAGEVLQKSAFAEIGNLMILGATFHDFGWPWINFDDCRPGDWLEI